MVFVFVVPLFVFFVVAFEVDPFIALFLHVGDELFNSVFLSVINSRHQIRNPVQRYYIFLVFIDRYGDFFLID